MVDQDWSRDGRVNTLKDTQQTNSPHPADHAKRDPAAGWCAFTPIGLACVPVYAIFCHPLTQC